ncbi:hypothetical protein SLE2022_339030 [Rubroshorea leprosula]
MGKSTSTWKDVSDLFESLGTADAATPSKLNIIDLYIGFAPLTALIQIIYMAMDGSFPFNAFLSGVLSCIGSAVLAICLRIKLNKGNKEFKDLSPEQAFADFVFCSSVLYLVVMNFFG